MSPEIGKNGDHRGGRRRGGRRRCLLMHLGYAVGRRDAIGPAYSAGGIRGLRREFVL